VKQTEAHTRAALRVQGSPFLKGGETMAVFRIEKTKDYTIMSNHHLRNKTLSLKAKGLLSQMLSLPEDWDYTLAGLARINRESVDAIRTAVWELEKAGYIVRRQGRDGKGKMTAIEYIIYEQPQETAPEPEPPILDCPVLENPISDNPTSGNPVSDNPTQLNKEIQSKYKSIKERLKKDPINPILSSVPPEPDGIDTDGDGDFQNIESALRRNTRIDYLLESLPGERDILREMFGLVLDAAGSDGRQIQIAGSHYSPEFVRARFLRLTDHHLLYVLDCLKTNTTKIKNIKAYMLAALFNAPLTIDTYYQTLVSHDKAHGLI
jgi:hypothetical protein